METEPLVLQFPFRTVKDLDVRIITIKFQQKDFNQNFRPFNESLAVCKIWWHMFFNWNWTSALLQEDSWIYVCLNSDESFNSFEWIPDDAICHTKETEEMGKDKYLTFYTQASLWMLMLWGNHVKLRNN